MSMRLEQSLEKGRVVVDVALNVVGEVRVTCSTAEKSVLISGRTILTDKLTVREIRKSNLIKLISTGFIEVE